ncbi:MAG: extracellular solute-binding protein [Actinobacteria bacterium]|nr:extracellular solute-binding protein [Actinomycetota bacterium]
MNKAKIFSNKLLALLVVAGLSVGTLSACSSSDSGSSDKILRISTIPQGETGDKVWQQAADIFKANNPGWDVQFIIQDDDLYETVGLPNQLTGSNPPDAYYEWAGDRIVQRYNDGFATDLNEKIKSSKIGSLFNADTLLAGQVEGKTVLLPTGQDVTNVIWYDTDVFAKYKLTPPTTWEELLAICAKLKAAGITPFAMGNKDMWVAGNWFAHVYSRIIGEKMYHEIMTLQTPMNSPELVEAMKIVVEMKKNGYINASANSIADNEGYTLFFKGEAAMLPIGSWIVGTQKDEAPNKHMDFFNIPTISGGKGDQSSVIGVTVGYVINAKSEKIDKTVEFFEGFFSDKITAAWQKQGSSPVTKTAMAEQLDPLQIKLGKLIRSGAPIVAPPDTGYQLKNADALNLATQQVLDGVKTPKEALDEAQAKLAKK